MDRVKIGVIGVGNMGTEHMKTILAGHTPELELVAAADRRAERRDWARANAPKGVRVHTEGAELIADGRCQAVLIAVPHYEHPPLAIDAFDHGLHVMCEKPAGVYTKQVREMNEAAARHPELTFGLMFNQRTDCLYRKMREMITSGEMGAIKRVNWIITDWYRTQFYYDSGAWRATWDGEGGGALLNQCPHNLDLLQWICGMPASVTAFVHEGKWHDIEVEDDVTAYLTYPNGATGVFITTTGDAPGTNRFEITCEMGKLVRENGGLTLYRNAQSDIAFCKAAKQAFAKPDCTVSAVETDGSNPQHRGVLNAFAANVLRGEPLTARGEEGIESLTLSNAMHLSAWLKRPVELPLEEEVFLAELNRRRETSRRKEAESGNFLTHREETYGS
ncbi:MAG: Gfo/Idh/MocA family oxidoreductase [Firmicutes bacterium]|nr:Gfo/Idh/MocA family oxidoreductase [Bacillota bacterium]